ncbi:probable LRR receptor-like serine/threonine-protein kinase At4g36180 [Setaria italica]|uniref:probable LRR receptor-like serine/threonine-protein kinase At4g36180 n=1 Tax=Setaria italica TaxID=4555 RepID=UPI000BE5187B|nr:probable LRR receptor-like serine/threonine-protein kinase At4g36180 [Setaria italica]
MTAAAGGVSGAATLLAMCSSFVSEPCLSPAISVTMTMMITSLVAPMTSTTKVTKPLCFDGATALQFQIAPLLSLERLEHLDLSWNGFQEGSPRLPGSLRYLNLSNTGLGVGGDAGMVLYQLGISNLSRLQYLDLSNTWLEGVVPPQLSNLSNLEYLDISKIGFDGVLPPQLGNLSKLQYLDISGNDRMNSSDMSWVEQLQWLGYLDLGKVDLSKASNWAHAVNMVPSLRVLVLSDCKLACANQSLPYELRILDLASNLLEGEFPQCSGTMSQRSALILSKNNLSGMFPSFLQDCTQLGLLDLSGNKFTGRLPIWIGDLMELQYLSLSNNLFYGNIPFTITNLGKLHDLNLAGNSLSGAIPCRLSNLTAMAGYGKHDGGEQDWYFDTSPSMLSVLTKGQELHYGGFALPSMVSIDLSSNHLIGGIPEGLSSLELLKNLNLSRNYLNGKIPDKIGSMRSLESLDLSSNKFSGEIPQSLSNLSYLSYLNLSYNNLSGRIPSGSQLDTL